MQTRDFIFLLIFQLIRQHYRKNHQIKCHFNKSIKKASERAEPIILILRPNIKQYGMKRKKKATANTK